MAPLAPIASRNFAAPAASGAPAQGNQLCGKLAPVTDSQANYKNLLAYGLARGVTFGLLVFAVTPVIFTIPAHADSISVDLDTTNVVLQRSGNLYKHNSSVHVHNSNDYGFTLNLDTDHPDLVNNRDSTYRINSVTGYYKYLSANQWGYGMGSDATSFNPVSNATLADVTKDNNGDCYNISNCTIKLTFGANIDPKSLPTGSYSTSLTYIVTSKPAPYVPPTPPAPYIPPEPYVPSKPRHLAANRCTNRDYDNCVVEASRSYYSTNRDLVPAAISRGSLWATQDATSIDGSKKFVYDYTKAKWAFLEIALGGSEWKYHNGVRIYPQDGSLLMYVPRFVIDSNNNIRFCKDGSYGCDSANSLFSGDARNGFWVDAAELGCDLYNGDKGDGYGISNYSKDYDAISLAKTLVDAFGSPCPR